jgi:hypothetical protein
MMTIIPANLIHADSARFPQCSARGRIRKEVGDCFCRHPEHKQGGQIKTLTQCLACPFAGSNEPVPQQAPKVGDVLARILKERRKANASETCDCASHIQEMNNWGPDGCEQNITTIVGWLLQAASETPGVHRWIPEFVKATVLEGDVRDAIKEVREWQPTESA